jgi:undecaprenyl-diphosphatase
MTILQSIILGIIEGITEFLPISSTGHLIIVADFLNLENSDFFKTYAISIQLGAILSVAVLYLKTIIKYYQIIFKVTVSFLPTALIAILLYKVIRGLFMENLIIIATALILGGIALILLENNFKKRPAINEQSNLKNINYRQAFLIGLFQALAIIPGVSRSAATIMGGLSLRLNRKTIVEYSFILAMPVMLAATVFDLYKNPINLSNQQWLVWSIGFFISFITAILSIKFLIRYIKNHDFKIFAWYRIAFGLFVLLWQFF